MSGMTVSLATKGMIYCGGKIIKQLVTSLGLNISNLNTKVNLKLSNTTLNFQIVPTNINLKLNDVKINLKNNSSQLNIKIQD